MHCSAHNLSLEIQHGLDTGYVSNVNHSGVRQIALLLGAFLGQNVRVEGVLPLEFAGAGELKPLFGT